MKAVHKILCPICGNETTFAKRGVTKCNFCRQKFVASYDTKYKHYVTRPLYDLTSAELETLRAKTSNRKVE